MAGENTANYQVLGVYVEAGGGGTRGARVGHNRGVEEGFDSRDVGSPGGINDVSAECPTRSRIRQNILSKCRPARSESNKAGQFRLVELFDGD